MCKRGMLASTVIPGLFSTHGTVLGVLLSFVSAGPSAAEPVAMPELYGLSEPEARQVLGDAGFVGKIHFQETTGDECDREREKPNTVCGQSPAAGTRSEASLDVWVFVQLGEPVTMLRLPHPIQQKSEQYVRDAFAEEGFTGNISTKTTAYEDCTWQPFGLEEGQVCGLTLLNPETDEIVPLGGPLGWLRTEYPAGVDVVLHVMGPSSLDDKQGPVPQVIGLPMEEAVKTLDENGFTHVAVRFTEHENCAPPGYVCYMGKEPGTVAYRGPDQVDLGVATRYPGPMSSDRMPDLTGATIEQAHQTLDAAGIRGTIRIRTDDRGYCPGDQNLQPKSVCAQNPEPGHKLRGENYDSPIELLVPKTD